LSTRLPLLCQDVAAGWASTLNIGW
jgi:hypothetical protein